MQNPAVAYVFPNDAYVLTKEMSIWSEARPLSEYVTVVSTVKQIESQNIPWRYVLCVHRDTAVDHRALCGHSLRRHRSAVGRSEEGLT